MYFNHPIGVHPGNDVGSVVIAHPLWTLEERGLGSFRRGCPGGQVPVLAGPPSPGLLSAPDPPGPPSTAVQVE